MKVPPTNSNNMNGYNVYDEEHYFNEAGPPHAPPSNGNGAMEDYAPSPPVQDDDFSEYMWMENEEEFDKEVLQRLEEEELMEQCMLQHMLDDEHTPQSTNSVNLNNQNQRKTDSADVAKSTLNPHAAEFVPSWNRNSSTNEQNS